MRFPPKPGLCGLFFALAFSLAFGGTEEEGVQTIRSFSASPHLAEGEFILGLVGFFGEPLPPQWLILSTLKDKPGVLKESVFARGEVIAERRFQKLPGQDLPHIPIQTRGIRFDSLAAFAGAEKSAVENGVSFDSIHYQLRCREADREPVWMLSLVNRAQVVVGVVYVSAEDGDILRASWPLLEKRNLTETGKGS
ncbi:MAG: hypothetical protein AAF733_02605 [Verrucomicrobiota bacterium]